MASTQSKTYENNLHEWYASPATEGLRLSNEKVILYTLGFVQVLPPFFQTSTYLNLTLLSFQFVVLDETTQKCPIFHFFKVDSEKNPRFMTE